MKNITSLAFIITAALILAGCSMQSSNTPNTPNTGDTTVTGDISTTGEVETLSTDTEALKKLYVGLSVEQATEQAAQAATPFRVIELDGQVQAATMDYRIGRINAVVSSGVVTDIFVEGDIQAEAKTTYVNLSVEQAQELAQQLGASFRVVEVDGQVQAVTADYRPGRINVMVNSGIVTDLMVE